MSDSDRYKLAKEFECFLMKRRIEAIDDADDLKKVALELVDVNFGMRQALLEMQRQGWLGKSL